MSRRCGGRRRRKRRRGRKGGKCVQFGKFTRELRSVVECRREGEQRAPRSHVARATLPPNAKPQSFSADSPQCIAIAKCFLHSPTERPPFRQLLRSLVLRPPFRLRPGVPDQKVGSALARPAEKKVSAPPSSSVTQSSCFTVPRWHGACRE